jgi:hypothetical protein
MLHAEGMMEYYTHTNQDMDSTDRLDLHSDKRGEERTLQKNESGVYSTELFQMEAERMLAEHKAAHAGVPLFLYYGEWVSD